MKEAQELLRIAKSLAGASTPRELARYASKVEKLIRKELVNPRDLQTRIGSRYDGYYGTVYVVVLSVDTKGQIWKGYEEQNLNYIEFEEDAEFADITYPGPGPQKRNSSLFDIQKKSEKDTAEDFLANLAGWDGLKSEQGLDRKALADDIAKQINRAVSSRRPDSQDRLKINNAHTLIQGAYRPDYGESGRAEVNAFIKALERNLSSYKNNIKDFKAYEAEKGWIEFTVELK